MTAGRPPEPVVTETVQDFWSETRECLSKYRTNSAD